MKINRFLTLLAVIITLISCNSSNNKHESERIEPDFFRNLYTRELLDKSEFAEFYQSLEKEYFDSVMGSPQITLKFDSIVKSGDSSIAYFKYDIRVGNDYKVRSRSYDKIGMNLEPKKFITILGDSVQIGGKQDKPTVINLWFIGCRGCVAEIPALNRLNEKYSEKVNFIALTFDNSKDVIKFIKKTPFNLTHIASKDWKNNETSLRPYIKTIESYPYPETIFIDRNGTIRFIEGVLPHKTELDSSIKYFESIIEELLLPTKNIGHLADSANFEHGNI